MLKQAFLNNIQELYNQGLTNKEIGERTNKATSSVSSYLKRLGLTNKIADTWKTKNILKDKQLQNKIIELSNQGLTQKEISKELEISTEQIAKCYKANNISILGTTKYRTSTGLENFLLRLKESNNKYEYISGYENDNSKVKLRCKDCGEIIERWSSSTRSGRQFICYNCGKIKKEKREQEKKYIQEQKKKQKELNKALDSIQLSFLVCKHCGSLFVPIRNNQKYCSKRCSIRNHEQQKSRARLEKARANGNIDYSITLDKLIKRDNNNCYICNTQCNLNDFTIINNTKVAGNYYPSIDHVVPIANGGTHIWDNVRLAHRICNTLKSNKNIFCS